MVRLGFWRKKTTDASEITEGRFPVDRLPAMDAEKIWKGTGGNVEEIDVPGGATKEIYSSFDEPVGATVYSETYGAVRIDAAGKGTNMQLLVPPDFTSLTALEILFIPMETGASMHFSISTYFASYSGGENWDAGSETENNRDIGATVASQILNHDISDLVTGLAAGDRLNVILYYSSTVVDSNAQILGLRLKYT